MWIVLMYIDIFDCVNVCRMCLCIDYTWHICVCRHWKVILWQMNNQCFPLTGWRWYRVSCHKHQEWRVYAYLGRAIFVLKRLFLKNTSYCHCKTKLWNFCEMKLWKFCKIKLLKFCEKEFWKFCNETKKILVHIFWKYRIPDKFSITNDGGSSVSGLMAEILFSAKFKYCNLLWVNECDRKESKKLWIMNVAEY